MNMYGCMEINYLFDIVVVDMKETIFPGETQLLRMNSLNL